MRILLADDAALLREGLAGLLTTAGHKVVAQVADADALREQGLEGLAEPLCEGYARQLGADLLLLVGGNQRGTIKGLCRRDGVALGEVHDVDGPAALAQQPLDRIG